MKYLKPQLEKTILKRRALRELSSKKLNKFPLKTLERLKYIELKNLYELTFNKELTRNSRKERMSKVDGNVYLIYNKEDEVCKIGYSKNPTRRLMNLQVSYPRELKLMFYFKGAKKDEKALHVILDNYRLKGEWFKLCPEVLEVINKYKEELNV